MILECPECQTRFSVDADALGSQGRQVRCARCRHEWFQTIPASKPRDTRPPPVADTEWDDTDDFADDIPEAVAPIVDRLAPDTPATVEHYRRGRASEVGWLLLLLFITGLAAAVYFARDQVVDAWPPAWRLFATLGLEVQSPMMESPAGSYRQLQFINVAPAWATLDGAEVLILTGGLANAGAQEARVPLFEARFLNGAGETLDVRPIDSGFTRIAPGENLLFEMSLTNPHPETEQIELMLAVASSPADSGS